MTAFIPFLGVLLLLLSEGFLICRIALKTGFRLELSLALPLSSFLNVLLTYFLTIAGIPLNIFSLLGSHILVTLLLLITVILRGDFQNSFALSVESTKNRIGIIQKVLLAMAGVIIFTTIFYSFTHAILLPTFQYDSATNWTMRSQISFVDRRIAFDPDESRGMAKPQYPFLFHALQITANQGQILWNDTAANSILFLLSLGSFAGLTLIFSKLRGRFPALVITALIVGIPLLGLHLAQGYADINLVQFILLALSCLAVWLEERKSGRWLFLSAVFISAAVWTKSEGTVFGLIPWLLLVLFEFYRRIESRREIAVSIFSAVMLSLPWPLFAKLKELSLTPHSTDVRIGFRPEGLGEAFLGLFSRGSFGVIWYIIPVFAAIILYLFYKKDEAVERRQLPLLAWACLVFVSVLFVYLFTPNVRFLLNAESYYRQMMIPASMFVLSCGYCLKKI
ncbi:hypothetical protein A3A67_01740 [Candidatus Peribacteria bacterium RIFCSPLOWO2_01_FULL_51_18]|nr:MAG: hypothetical protein A3A67_01740 [Candidatus Peribacteria bacterium RIFCSPLOWO2_01_FULL_51_18]